MTNIALPVTGYLHETYARSLSEFGKPLSLPESEGWILARQIPGSPQLDGMGCYPIFSCRNWSGLARDIENLKDCLVSLALVADPFGDVDVELLRECFPASCIPFKQHFVIDLSRDPKSFVHSHHLRNAKKARHSLEVGTIEQPTEFLHDWVELYAGLVQRHQITGISAFSKNSFALQFEVPGLVVFRASQDNVTEGMLLWYVQGDVAYYHLGAYSERGYDLKASFALFHHALEYFSQLGLRWLNLGGAPGSATGTPSGLARFKEGWSSDVRIAYFCGRIIDPVKYKELKNARLTGETQYFPAYRAGEFV
ncbi:MAG TPA: GNAT family N-acetyltransferase [Pyrinomonadaceae bacterium]|nr:GNAT family N-acetyltransferase [Pyrinomonadaceae bacterium]